MHICIVLYNCNFLESKALQSLIRLDDYLDGKKIEVYLNGKCIHDFEFCAQRFTIHDNKGENFYLLDNYIKCVEIASKQNSEWIVFFDQDTEITQEYLVALNSLADLDKDCVASFPILKAQTKFVSPKTLFHGTLFPSRLLKPGKCSGIDFLGLNSGSIYRISFLKTIIDISDEFRLDFIDYVFSYNVYKSGKSFNVMDVVLEHDMAVLKNQSLDKDRARSILSAEYKYYRCYRGKLAFYLYKIKLLFKYSKSLLSKNYLYKSSILKEFLLKVN